MSKAFLALPVEYQPTTGLYFKIEYIQLPFNATGRIKNYSLPVKLNVNGAIFALHEAPVLIEFYPTHFIDNSKSILLNASIF